MPESFETKVAHQIESLKKYDYSTLESEIAQKRTAWLGQHDVVLKKKPVSPRIAFELLFLQKMGLSPEDLPVVVETEQEIEWLSLNRCPTLEACKKLDLDTKTVCRAINEKSTQTFMSHLDPELRFCRSYREIRPYSNHCREKIIKIDFESMMRIAIKEAVHSKSEGNKGYGAVIVMEDQILSRAHDTAITERDPCLHAEVNAIRQAVKKSGDTNLCGAILFSTCEPCPMCTSLAVWSNLTTIVYGASIEETARLGKSRIHISAEEVIGKSPVMIEVVPDVLQTECRALYM